MTRFVGLGVAMGVLVVASWSVGQELPYRGGEPQGQPIGPLLQPDQPVVPQDPVLRPAAPPPPFTLTAKDETKLDRVLDFWEQSSVKVKDYSGKFTRWTYDEVGGAPEKKFLTAVDYGEIRFSAPDKAESWIDKGPRREHWICDGNSVFVYDFKQAKILQYPIAPEYRGEAITKGPLPFLFGAKKANLKRRYFLQITTPQDAAKKEEIWLEAYPRSLADARDFSRTQVILTPAGGQMLPSAVRIFQPSGKQWEVYQLRDQSVNPFNPLAIFGDKPFTPHKPGPEWRFELGEGVQQAEPPRRQAQGGVAPPALPSGRRPGTLR